MQLHALDKHVNCYCWDAWWVREFTLQIFDGTEKKRDHSAKQNAMHTKLVWKKFWREIVTNWKVNFASLRCIAHHLPIHITGCRRINGKNRMTLSVLAMSFGCLHDESEKSIRSLNNVNKIYRRVYIGFLHSRKLDAYQPRIWCSIYIFSWIGCVRTHCQCRSSTFIRNQWKLLQCCNDHRRRKRSLMPKRNHELITILMYDFVYVIMMSTGAVTICEM